MLCENCGVNKATTHIHSVINGVASEKYLCSNCATKEGYSDIKSNNLSQMLSSMFGETITDATPKNIIRCNCCGATFADIASSGRCGCAGCYSTFYEQLLPYFKRLHGSTKHTGKIINCNFSRNEPAQTVESLRELLSKLIQDENYEQAAVIRDKIKSLQEGV